MDDSRILFSFMFKVFQDECIWNWSAIIYIQYRIGYKSIWHDGGNIGSATYMIYLPEFHASAVVMVNTFPAGSVDYDAKNLIPELSKTPN